jgi:hypothetical protein
MTSELDEPMTVPSLHSLCNVNASELYPKQDLQEATLPEDVNSDVCSEPFAPVFGESIEYLSRVSDGGVLALSNYRLVIDFTNHAFFSATILLVLFQSFSAKRGLQLQHTSDCDRSSRSARSFLPAYIMQRRTVSEVRLTPG